MYFTTFLKVTTHAGVTAANECDGNVDATEQQVIHFTPWRPYHHLHPSGVSDSVHPSVHKGRRRTDEYMHPKRDKNIEDIEVEPVCLDVTGIECRRHAPLDLISDKLCTVQQ